MPKRKGRRFQNISVSLTPEQIAWLSSKPNASELIRKLIDDLIAAEKSIQPKLELISLDNQIKELEEQKQKLKNQQFEYVYQKKDLWKKNDDGSIEWEDIENEVPKPLEGNKDSIIAYKVAKERASAIKLINAKIEEFKRKVIESNL